MPVIVKGMPGNRACTKLALVVAAMTIGLSGCSHVSANGADPIEWYRDLSGSSADDVKDQAPNSKNLAEGNKEPYPNLASVPKQPENAITKADRDRLAKSLIADRQNAQYTDEKLHAGQNMSAVPPPGPEPTIAGAPPTPANRPAPAPARPAAAAVPPRVAAAPVQPVQRQTLPPGPTASLAPSAPAPATPTAATAPPNPAPGPQSAQASAPKGSQMANAATPSEPPAKKKDDAKKKQANVKRGAEPPPAESSLRPPTARPMPQGEASIMPPPAPPGTGAKSRSLRPPHEELAAAPTRSDIDAGGRNTRIQAAEIKFAPGPYHSRILPADHKQLVEVAKMVQHNNGRVRIVGYGAASSSKGDSAQREFQSFNIALDNAKAVGVELAKLGVPPNRIDIETSANVNAPDRADVFVEY